MKSHAHAAISAVVAALALLVTTPPVSPLVVAAVPAVWLWSPYLAGLVAATLYAHVLADLVATVRKGVVLHPEDPRLEPGE